VNAWEAAVPVRVHAAAPDPGTRNRAQAVACAVRAGLI
jgi:hypothetical protein